MPNWSPEHHLQKIISKDHVFSWYHFVIVRECISCRSKSIWRIIFMSVEGFLLKNLFMQRIQRRAIPSVDKTTELGGKYTDFEKEILLRYSC